MQWGPFLPKEGGLIHVDIGGHPPFPTGPKQFSGNFGNLLFLVVFWVLKLSSHFEALNDVFWENGEQHGSSFDVSPKMSLLDDTFWLIASLLRLSDLLT
jgi:hypothetical protein